MHKKWNATHTKWVKKHGAGMTIAAIARALDCSYDMAHHNVKRLQLPHKPSVVINRELVEKIAQDYMTMRVKDLCVKYNMGVSRMKNLLQHYNIKLPAEIRAARISATKIQKGTPAWNKGLKLPHLQNKNRFEKGHLPTTTLYDGAITIREQRGRKYQYVRMSQGKWDLLHRVVWEKANGAVPAGHAIFFKDGNSLNCVLDNLECISRKELGKRNQRPRSQWKNDPVERMARKLYKGKWRKAIKENRDLFVLLVAVKEAEKAVEQHRPKRKYKQRSKKCA